MVCNRLGKFWHTPPEPHTRPQTVLGELYRPDGPERENGHVWPSVVYFLGNVALWMFVAFVMGYAAGVGLRLGWGGV